MSIKFKMMLLSFLFTATSVAFSSSGYLMVKGGSSSDDNKILPRTLSDYKRAIPTNQDRVFLQRISDLGWEVKSLSEISVDHDFGQIVHINPVDYSQQTYDRLVTQDNRFSVFQVEDQFNQITTRHVLSNDGNLRSHGIVNQDDYLNEENQSNLSSCAPAENTAYRMAGVTSFNLIAGRAADLLRTAEIACIMKIGVESINGRFKYTQSLDEHWRVYVAGYMADSDSIRVERGFKSYLDDFVLWPHHEEPQSHSGVEHGDWYHVTPNYNDIIKIWHKDVNNPVYRSTASFEARDTIGEDVEIYMLASNTSENYDDLRGIICSKKKRNMHSPDIYVYYDENDSLGTRDYFVSKYLQGQNETTRCSIINTSSTKGLFQDNHIETDDIFESLKNKEYFVGLGSNQKYSIYSSRRGGQTLFNLNHPASSLEQEILPPLLPGEIPEFVADMVYRIILPDE